MKAVLDRLDADPRGDTRCVLVTLQPTATDTAPLEVLPDSTVAMAMAGIALLCDTEGTDTRGRAAGAST